MIRYHVPMTKPRGAMYHGPGNAESAAGLALYHRANSIRGVRYAATHGFDWIDNDYMLTADRVLVCSHSFHVQAHEHFRGPGVPHRPINLLTAAQVARLVGPGGYRVQNAETMFRAYSRLGIGVAFEVKDKRMADPEIVGEIIGLANRHNVRMYAKCDPDRPELLPALDLFHDFGVWTRHNGSWRFRRPA